MLCFHFCWPNFWFSFWFLLLPIVYSRVLFNFHMFVIFPVFFLLVISNFIPLWSEKIFYISSMFLNLSRLSSWPNLWSIPENVLCGFEKNVYSGTVGYNVLCMSVRFHWSIVLFTSAVSYWFSVRMITHCWKWNIVVPYYYCIAENFYFQFC